MLAQAMLNASYSHADLESHLCFVIEKALNTSPIWPQAKPYFSNFGRLIRSQLFYAGLQTFSFSSKESDKSLLELAATIELFQTFLLIHDDIADHALLRRGGPSLLALVGSENALIVGDMIYTLALQRISEVEGLSSELRLSLIKSLLQVAHITGLGQLADQNGFSLGNSDEVLNMYANKTGFYSIYLPLKWAHILSNNSNPVEASLLKVAQNLGQAYQLIDDLENLGLSKNRNLNPKDLTNDYKQKKRTLLWSELSNYQKAEWDFNRPFEDFLSELTSSGLYENLADRAQRLVQEALLHAQKLSSQNENLLIQKLTEIYEPRIAALI